jgi:hypothetical protein
MRIAATNEMVEEEIGRLRHIHTQSDQYHKYFDMQRSLFAIKFT